MDLNARVDVNCGRKDGRTDGRTENRTPISHLAKAGATKSRSRLNAEGGVNLYSSRCMHDPNFMALALIVSEKMT